MTKYFIYGLLVCGLASSVMAEKPVYAGDGQPTAEQKTTHKEAMTSKADEYKKQQEKQKKASGGQVLPVMPEHKAH